MQGAYALLHWAAGQETQLIAVRTLGDPDLGLSRIGTDSHVIVNPSPQTVLALKQDLAHVAWQEARWLGLGIRSQ